VNLHHYLWWQDSFRILFSSLLCCVWWSKERGGVRGVVEWERFFREVRAFDLGFGGWKTFSFPLSRQSLFLFVLSLLPHHHLFFVVKSCFLLWTMILYVVYTVL
jgi:hypothetical protein